MLTDLRDLAEAWLDLGLGSRCSGCGAPGRALCGTCAVRLPTRPFRSWPTPAPAGLVPPTSTGEYAGALKALVLDHKEHRRMSLARPLGRLLALAVAEAADDAWPDADDVLRLVPVPSHGAVVRSRGHDPLTRVAREAAAELRRRGRRAGVAPLLAVRRRPEDQAGLDSTARARNVAGRFAARPGAAGGSGPVLLVDDVITTGATLREAQRALEAVGVEPVAAATVAATRRRLPGSAPVPLPRGGPGH